MRDVPSDDPTLRFVKSLSHLLLNFINSLLYQSNPLSLLLTVKCRTPSMMAAQRLLPSLKQAGVPGFTGVVRKGLLQKS